MLHIVKWLSVGSGTGIIPGYGPKTSRKIVTFSIVEKQQPLGHCLGILPAAHSVVKRAVSAQRSHGFQGQWTTSSGQWILPTPEGPAAGKLCSCAATLVIHNPLSPPEGGGIAEPDSLLTPCSLTWSQGTQGLGWTVSSALSPSTSWLQKSLAEKHQPLLPMFSCTTTFQGTHVTTSQNALTVLPSGKMTPPGWA